MVTLSFDDVREVDLMGKNNNSKDLGKNRGQTLDENDKNTNLRQSHHNDRNEGTSKSR